MTDATPERRNFYGRIRGKTLRASQHDYLADLDRWRLTGISRAENPLRAPVGNPFPGRALWLEIGFGSGEHLVHVAQANPGVGLIGAEPFVNGLATCLGKLRLTPDAALRLHPGDVRDLLEVLPAGGLLRVYLNYPDPWPKARHHRRRFVTPGYLVPLARAMAGGAELRLATDIADYARQAREEVPPAGFTLQADSGTPWEGWLSTRYEQKALREGRVPQYLVFRRS
jgi:tRNA (guanine-N7-)-methyltransferase